MLLKKIQNKTTYSPAGFNDISVEIMFRAFQLDATNDLITLFDNRRASFVVSKNKEVILFDSGQFEEMTFKFKNTISAKVFYLALRYFLFSAKKESVIQAKNLVVIQHSTELMGYSPDDTPAIKIPTHQSLFNDAGRKCLKAKK